MNGKWPGALTAEIIESISDEEFWCHARELALLTPAETPPAEYLRCELGCGRCLIPMTSLYEVVPPPHHFALLPAIPAWMPGVFAWHAETIAVVDLDAYLLANESQVGNDPDKSSSVGHDGSSSIGRNERERAYLPPGQGPIKAHPAAPHLPRPYGNRGNEREPRPYGKRGDPISPGRMESSTGTLLIARYSGLAVGLLVPTTDLATTTEPASKHEESGSFILNIPAVLMDIVQQIGIAARYE
jgi:hypothetical protein